jgi:exonuclease VII small subunit
MVGDLLNFAKSLLGLKADLDKTALERRQRVGSYLDKVTDCLEQIIKKFREGTESYSQCSELDEYLNSLVEIVGKEVGEDKLKRYEKRLASAAYVRGQASSAFLQESSLSSVGGGTKSQEAELRVLEDAVGRFKALANSLRV